MNIQSIVGSLTRRMSLNPALWLADTRKMCELVKRFEIKKSHDGNVQHAGIVLIPWMGTAVPWFCLVMGLFLAKRGSRVTFILDDMPFAGDRLSTKLQVHCLKQVLSVMMDRFPMILLSTHVTHAELGTEAIGTIDRLAALNAVWALRGEMVKPKRARLTARAARQLRASYGAIEKVVSSDKFDLMFIPGGVWGSSGVWMKHASEAGIRISSFDSGGYGTLLLAVDGIACQLHDIPRAFSMLKSEMNCPERLALVTKTAREEMERRRSGTDKFSSQVTGSSILSNDFKGGVLIALNSSWDSAALGMHDVYVGGAEWIVDTVKYVLENTTVPVIVRQHPAERLEIARTSDDYAGLLAKNFGDNPRLHFISAHQAVNSYELIEQVCAVVTHTSTIGLEAAANGKPVITASRAYYADLGFVWKARSVSHYHALLCDAVAGRLTVTPAMESDGLACYYLTQCCNWVYTPYNVPDFKDWVNNSLESLFLLDNVQRVLTAVEKNIPAAMLNHQVRVATELHETISS